jgi:hypothetical protein
MQETRSEARNQRVGGGLEERFQSSVPTTRYEYADVFFEAAGVDVAVPHLLRPLYPNQVNYEVVQATAPVQIYHDGGADRRSWTADAIFLRSDTDSVWVRLRLSLPADDAGLRQGSVNAVDAGARYAAADLLVAGDLAVSGVLDLDGGQIAFPATQVPSTDANTLDDYEEGTWTPELRFGGATTGITYTTQIGYYVKVGRLVLASLQITLSSKGSATGAASIAGLAFTAQNLTGTLLHVGSSLAAGMAGLTSAISPRMVGGTALIDMFDWGATGIAGIDDTNFTNTSVLAITIAYAADT